MNLEQIKTTTGDVFINFLDSEHVRYKTGGVTIDKTTVTSGSDDRKILRAGSIICEITATGKYGPFDSGASDGRQTPTMGKCFILADSVDVTFSDAQEGAIDMARVLIDRLPIKPTEEIKKALPMISWV
ncbi:hypothetical protein A0J52_09940 [Clostridium sporogenes]|uniref:head decoration protein n=1 Tax=Clostridium sporogenes TaxID=1509 RepID=UPI00077FFFE8|nr:head decoration protein [Clostridium sporogenes]KYN77172.1 hypothetical protein A0J52_09940 [Clostridium sporogenes]